MADGGSTQFFRQLFSFVRCDNSSASNAISAQISKTLSATPDKRLYNYQLTVQNLNNPPHITAHLQATQTHHTNPSLQKSCNFPTTPATIDNPNLVSKFRGQN
jgi:hypothetical protein